MRENFGEIWVLIHASHLNKLNELVDLFQLANEENNQQIVSEVFVKIKELKIEVKKNEIKCFLSNENDRLDCFLEIHAGAGGTESQDWALMLRRMYIKWADK